MSIVTIWSVFLNPVTIVNCLKLQHYNYDDNARVGQYYDIIDYRDIKVSR